MKLKVHILLLTIFSIIPYCGICQSSNTVTDPRDGQEYRTLQINGTIWMLDNLNYETARSLQTESTREYAPSGRFYHLFELDSVCPEGWTVSRKEDWISYFDYLIDNSPDTTLRIQENDLDEITEIDHWGKLDLFNDINPLELKHTGWFEGGKWMDQKVLSPPNTNYWVLEPGRDELERTHVHINEIRARIHRHEHHLKPKQEKKLRQFMVRCVYQ